MDWSKSATHSDTLLLPTSPFISTNQLPHSRTVARVFEDEILLAVVFVAVCRRPCPGRSVGVPEDTIATEGTTVAQLTIVGPIFTIAHGAKEVELRLLVSNSHTQLGPGRWSSYNDPAFESD
jgi:hypothetical protein